MKKGFTKAWRKELESDIWLMSPIYHRVWFWLRQKVQHELHFLPTHKKFGIWVLPGQRITSYQQIAEGVKWHEWGQEKIPNKRTISAVIDWLKDSGMIEVESNAHGTLITVINWHIYNSVVNGESNADETGSAHKKRMIKNKEEKPKKTLSPKKPVTYSSDHQLFIAWFCYAFQELNQRKYIFQSGKDAKLISEMLKVCPLTKLVARACHYLLDTKCTSHSIGFFQVRLNDYSPDPTLILEKCRSLEILPSAGQKLKEWMEEKENEKDNP